MFEGAAEFISKLIGGRKPTEDASRYKMRVDPNAPEAVKAAAMGTGGSPQVHTVSSADGIAQEGARQMKVGVLQPSVSEWKRKAGDPLNPQDLK